MNPFITIIPVSGRLGRPLLRTPDIAVAYASAIDQGQGHTVIRSVPLQLTGKHDAFQLVCELEAHTHGLLRSGVEAAEAGEPWVPQQLHLLFLDVEAEVLVSRGIMQMTCPFAHKTVKSFRWFPVRGWVEGRLARL